MKQIKFVENYIKDKCYDLTITFDWVYKGYNFIDESIGYQHDYEITTLLLDYVSQYCDDTDDFNECIVLRPEQRLDIRNWLFDELLNNKHKYGINYLNPDYYEFDK